MRETTETESQNRGYKFGLEDETDTIGAAHGYFGNGMNFNHSILDYSIFVHQGLVKENDSDDKTVDFKVCDFRGMDAVLIPEKQQAHGTLQQTSG